jgi:hypothetical protein
VATAVASDVDDRKDEGDETLLSSFRWFRTHNRIGGDYLCIRVNVQ